MTAFLRLVFLVPLAYILAVVAAAAVVIVGAFQPPDAEWLAYFAPSIVLVAMYAAGAAFAPAALAIVVAEALRIRSIFYFLAVGGVVGLVLNEIAGFAGWADLIEQQPVLLPAAGFAGAFVYWLVAGRLSGNGFGAAEPTSRG